MPKIEHIGYDPSEALGKAVELISKADSFFLFADCPEADVGFYRGDAEQDVFFKLIHQLSTLQKGGDLPFKVEINIPECEDCGLPMRVSKVDYAKGRRRCGGCSEEV